MNIVPYILSTRFIYSRLQHKHLSYLRVFNSFDSISGVPLHLHRQLPTLLYLQWNNKGFNATGLCQIHLDDDCRNILKGNSCNSSMAQEPRERQQRGQNGECSNVELYPEHSTLLSGSELREVNKKLLQLRIMTMIRTLSSRTTKAFSCTQLQCNIIIKEKNVHNAIVPYDLVLLTNNRTFHFDGSYK